MSLYRIRNVPSRFGSSGCEPLDGAVAPACKPAGELSPPSFQPLPSRTDGRPCYKVAPSRGKRLTTLGLHRCAVPSGSRDRRARCLACSDPNSRGPVLTRTSLLLSVGGQFTRSLQHTVGFGPLEQAASAQHVSTVEGLPLHWTYADGGDTTRAFPSFSHRFLPSESSYGAW